MTKYLICLAFYFYTFISSSQSKEEQTKSILELYKFPKSNSDTSTFKRHLTLFNKEGLVISKYDFCSSSFGCKESKYEFERRHDFEYDEKGNEILDLFFSEGESEPTVITETINKYDTLGLLIEKSSNERYVANFDSTDWGTHITLFEYDSNKNLIKKTNKEISAFRNVSWETLFKYDSQNNLIERIQPNDGIQDIKEKFEYDSLGNPIKYQMIGGPTTIHYVETASQKFNAEGKVIETLETQYDGKETLTKYTYNSSGLVSRVEIIDNGSVRKIVEKNYYESGELRQIISKDSKENIDNIRIFIYEYF